MLFGRLLLFATFAGFAAGPLAADVAYQFTSAADGTGGTLSLGFVFTASTAVTIDALGYYSGSGGFDTSHTVGIYNSSGTLLTSTSLSAGTADPLLDGFRYENIAPITLAAGTYTLAATTVNDWLYGNAYAADGGVTLTGFIVDPAITIGQNAARYVYQSSGTILQDPLSHFSNYTVYIGPNFSTTPVGNAVPEPTSAVGICIAGGALLLIRRLRRPSPQS
jgi:hypothetical protein